MLARMSYRQLRYWAAFATLEPFGSEHEDMRIGVLTALTANVNRDAKRTPTPYRPQDFFPTLDRRQHGGRGRRVPITDPAEWAKTKSQAKLFAGGKD